MKYSINYTETLNDNSLTYVITLLPIELQSNIIDFLNKNRYTSINEIRIKRNSYINLIANSKNVITDIFVSEELVNKTLDGLCDGSIYAHINTIRDGYISVGKGIRAGICGKAVIENGIITGICDVSSINIRIPKYIQGAGKYVFSILEKNNFKKSILIYSPPGVGKTTILRDIITRLSNLKTPIRTAIIDSREEITPFLTDRLNCDVFLSYPKGLAIELATKSMTPEIIICDEISSESEANAILKASHSGVRLVATAHSGSFSELMSKEILSPLIKGGIFDYAVGVKRENGEKKYTFECKELTNK